MELSDLITLDAVLPALRSPSKKQVLHEMAERAALVARLDARQVFDTVMNRERLGSTGIGNGIAIPHGKISGLPSIRGVFGRLVKPVDFEAMDDRPVDLVFLLLAPDEAGADHLKALSKIARLLRDPATVANLRALRDADAIHALLTQRR